MVRNRSSLGFFFFNKIKILRHSSLTDVFKTKFNYSENRIIFLNYDLRVTRRRLLYRLLKTTLTQKFNLIYTFNTSFYKARFAISTQLFFLYNAVFLTFPALTKTNHYFLTKNYKSLFFFFNLGLNFFILLIQTEFLFFITNCAWFRKTTTYRFLFNVFLNWRGSWRFKHYRTVFQTPLLITLAMTIQSPWLKQKTPFLLKKKLLMNCFLRRQTNYTGLITNGLITQEQTTLEYRNTYFTKLSQNLNWKLVKTKTELFLNTVYYVLVLRFLQHYYYLFIYKLLV